MKGIRTINKKQRVEAKRLAVFSIELIILIIATNSCAVTTTYLAASNDVSHQFESGEVLQGYRYYYGGPQLKPNAVVAIGPGYRLESPHWHEMDVTSALLKKLINTITFVPDAEYKTTPNGARIFTPNGDLIGFWYSVFEYPQVRLIGKKKVYLSEPTSRLPWQTRMKKNDD